MKLLIVLVAFLFVTTGTGAYSSGCTKGPEYWCRDASTAKECGAVRHCEQTVWHEKRNNKQSMSTSETAEMLCTALVRASTTLLADDSMNVDSIKQYLRHDCTKLPDQNNLIQQCEMAVDHYLSDILRHIQRGTESTKICQIIQKHDTSNAFIPKPKPGDLTSNATCILCEFFIHILESIVTVNASQQELVVILDKVCSEMPEVLRSECKDFVDTYGADIIALLVREVDPDKTCEFIKVCPKPKNVAFLTKPNVKTCGLCDYVSTYLSAGYPVENVCNHFSTDNNVKQQCEILVHLYKPNICSQLPLCFDNVLPEQSIEPTVNSVECSLCEFVVGYIDKVIENNRTEAAAEAALEIVCDILKPLKDKCDEFVKTYGAELFTLLEKYGTPKAVCHFLKLCTAETQETISQKLDDTFKVKQPTASLECSICEFVVNYIDTAIQTNKSEAAIEAALEKVCGLIKPIKQECDNFVKNNTAAIIELITKGLTPTQICDELKLCKNGTQEFKSLEHVELSDLTKPSPNSAECTLCKTVIGILEKTIGENKSTAAVEAALDQICNILPKSVRDNCTHFVHHYAIVVAFLLRENKTAVQICDSIKLCNNGTQEITPPKSAHMFQVNELTDSVECTICEFVMNFLESVIGNNKSESIIEAALEVACGFLTPAKEKCDEWVKNYTAIIIELVVQGVPAGEICDTIKICMNGTQQIIPAKSNDMLKVNVPTASLQCSICEFVVNYIDTAIQTNKSEAAIESALEKVCGLIKPIKQECDDFVKNNTAAIIELITKGLTPTQICDELKLCKNGTEEIIPRKSNDVFKVNVPTASLECSICEFVMNYLEKAIQNNKSEAAIEAALEKVCSLLTPVKEKCDEFVKNYTAAIIELIEKGLTPVQICDTLNLCKNGTQQITPAKSYDMFKVNVPTASLQCSICEFVVNYIDTAIQTNKSEAAIESALEKVCGLIKPIKQECDDFVKNNTAAIIELITKGLTPTQICDELKLCKNGTQEVTRRKPDDVLKVNVPTASLECSICEFLLNYVDTVIQTNKSEAAIEAALEKVCGLIKPIKQECDAFVNNYTAVIVELITKGLTPTQICDELKLCKNGTQEVTPRKPDDALKVNAPTASLECSICEFVMNYLEKAIQNNKSEAAIEAALEKVCSLLTPVKEKCDEFVKNYTAAIIELIEKGLTPAQICDTLNLCKNGTQQITPAKSNDMFKVNVPTASLQCSICEFVVNYIDTAIQTNKSEAAIESALEKVCGLIKPIKQECDNFVKNNTAAIIELITKGLTPTQICDELKLCKNGTQEVTPQKPVDVLKVNAPTASLECSICEFLLNYVDTVIQTNKSEAAVEAALEKVCGLIKPIKQECDDFVKNNTAAIIELITKGLTPTQICDELKLCKNGTQQITPLELVELSELTQSSPNSAECTLCKTVIGILEKTIGENKSTAAVEAALDQICNILPKSIRDNCTHFVHHYAIVVAFLLRENKTAVQICDTIKVCKNGTQEITSLLAMSNDMFKVNKPIGTLECSICEFVMNYLEKVVQNNKSEAAIEAALEAVCGLIKSVKEKCDDLVKNYTADIIELIEKGLTPAEICDTLKLCKKELKAGEIKSHKNTKSVKGAAECSLCKYVISFINVLIESNATEQEVENGLKIVCSLLPSDLHSKCGNFVTTYGPILPQLIAELDDPNVVCEWLAFCTKSNDTFIEIPTLKSEKLKGLPCNLCQYLVNYLDAIIQSNSTETKFEEALEKACKILPGTKLESECKVVVDLYGVDLIKLLVEFGNPKTVCQELGICDK